MKPGYMGNVNGPGCDPDVPDFTSEDLGWEWETCPDCAGDGMNGHDCPCGDTCCCRYPEENIRCQTCDGEGGWEPKPSKTETPEKESHDG